LMNAAQSASRERERELLYRPPPTFATPCADGGGPSCD
jgi:hypothetical protein